MKLKLSGVNDFVFSYTEKLSSTPLIPVMSWKRKTAIHYFLVHPGGIFNRINEGLQTNIPRDRRFPERLF